MKHYAHSANTQSGFNRKICHNIFTVKEVTIIFFLNEETAWLHAKHRKFAEKFLFINNYSKAFAKVFGKYFVLYFTRRHV